MSGGRQDGDGGGQQGQQGCRAWSALWAPPHTNTTTEQDSRRRQGRPMTGCAGLLTVFCISYHNNSLYAVVIEYCGVSGVELVVDGWSEVLYSDGPQQGRARRSVERTLKSRLGDK